MQPQNRSFQNQIKEQLVKKIKPKCDILGDKLTSLAKERVPIDSGKLQDQGISKQVKLSNNKMDISTSVFIRDIYVEYEDATKNLRELGAILELGKYWDKKGQEKMLKRTKSQPRNPARSLTKNWWKQFIQDAHKYVKKDFK